MALYRKLAYARSIWSLILYPFVLVITLGAFAVTPPIISSFLDHSPEVTYNLLMLGKGLSLCIIGTVTSIIVIKSISEINPTMKKLATVLIISAIVFAVTPYVESYLSLNLDHMRDGEHNRDDFKQTLYQSEKNYFGLVKYFTLEIIPSFYII